VEEMKKHLVILDKKESELRVVRTDNERLGTHNFPSTREGWEELTDYLDTQGVEGFSVTFEVHEWLVQEGL
jgi:hypothetical protein